MKQLLFISLFLLNICYGQRIIVNGHKHSGAAPDPVVVAQFNCTYDVSSSGGSSASGIAGWVDVLDPTPNPSGLDHHPNEEVRTATDNRSGSNITITTIATGNWIPVNSSTCSSNEWGPTSCNGSCYVPVGLTRGGFGVQGNGYSPGTEQLEFGGLNPAKQYTIELGGSRTTGNPSRRVRYYIIDNVGTASQILDVKDNTANYVSFTGKIPTAGGIIKFAMDRDPTDANNIWGAYVSWVRIIQTN